VRRGDGVAVAATGDYGRSRPAVIVRSAAIFNSLPGRYSNYTVLALYWTVSNCYSLVQTAVLHDVVARRVRSGAVLI
jgi:hypothetical protein